MPMPSDNSYSRKNLYKQKHIFRCVHDVHSEFKSQMSPFHILNEKKCYPGGCVYFKWKCKLLAKHKKCFRKFEHVGRECFNCKYFYEEKIHQYPELTESQSQHFLTEFENFESWVEHLRKKRVNCEGTVADVRPNITLQEYHGNYRKVLRGFLISFRSGYIDNHNFEDDFFLSLSPLSQNQLKFRSGDEVEFEATFAPDRGRFKFIKCGRLVFYKRGQGDWYNKSQVLVNLQTATVQDGKPVKCMNCANGILSDIETRNPGPRRSIVCLAGERDYKFCSSERRSNGEFASETCAAMSCRHTL